MEHYILPILYRYALNRNIQYALGVFALAVGVIAFATLARGADTHRHGGDN